MLEDGIFELKRSWLGNVPTAQVALLDERDWGLDEKLKAYHKITNTAYLFEKNKCHVPKIGLETGAFLRNRL